MMQSPKKKPEARVRLAVVDESTPASPRRDSISSPTLKQVACNSAVKKVYKKQHKRHMSAPDDMIMMSALRNIRPAPPRLPDGSAGFGHHQLAMGTEVDANGALVKPDHRPLTPPNARRASLYSPMTPQSPFLHNIGNPMKNIPGGGHIRRASLMNIPSGMRMVFGPDSMDEMFSRSDALPTPPHTAPIRGISQFDMGALHNSQFMSMSSIALDSVMPGDGEIDASYFSPISEVSPSFSSMQSTPEAQHVGIYGQMPSCTADMSSQMPAPVNPMNQPPPGTSQAPRPLPPLAPAPNGLNLGPDAKAVIAATCNIIKRPRQMHFNTQPSTITQDDIASFISGPEPTDGKWVCLFGDCNKRFGRKENIKSHVQTHLGDRQYKCHVCRKCFVRQHDLKRHSKIHTGVKPYECRCGNSFARHDALTRHRQRGMCIGAFEGIVKKVVKRGRPRKKPLPEGDDSGKKDKDDKSSNAESKSPSKIKSKEPPSSTFYPSLTTSTSSMSASSSTTAAESSKSRTASPDSTGTPPPLSAPPSPTHFDFHNFLSDSPHPHPPQVVDTSSAPSSSPLQIPTTSSDYSAFRKFSEALENPIVTSASAVASGITSGNNNFNQELELLNGEMGHFEESLLDFSAIGGTGSVLGLCSAPEDSYIRPEVLGDGFVR